MAGKDKETLTDSHLRRLKNNRIVAAIVVVAIVIVALIGFAEKINSAWKMFVPEREKPAATPSSATAPQPSTPPAQQTPTPETKAEATTPPSKPEPSRPDPKVDSSSKDRVFADCQMGVLPSIVPPEGRIHVLQAQELPQESGGGGLGDLFGTPGSEWKWSSPRWAYRCELTNYSPDVLFNVVVAVRLTFRSSVPVPGQEKARRQGEITLDREWPFTIPKLDPSPSAPYAFYVTNVRPKFLQVRLPEAVLTGGRRIPLLQSDGSLSLPLNPVPFD